MIDDETYANANLSISDQAKSDYAKSDHATVGLTTPGQTTANQAIAALATDHTTTAGHATAAHTSAVDPSAAVGGCEMEADGDLDWRLPDVIDETYELGNALGNGFQPFGETDQN